MNSDVSRYLNLLDSDDQRYLYLHYAHSNMPHTRTLLPSSSSVQEAGQQIGISVDEDDEEVYKIIEATLEHAMEEVDAVVDRYGPQLNRILERNGPETMTQAFLQVAERVFSNKKITSLHIFVLLRFSYKLVQCFLRKKSDQHLETKVTDFIILVGKFLFKTFHKYSILHWVREMGGWRRLLSFKWTGLVICAGVFLVALGLWKLSSNANPIDASPSL